MKHAWLVSSLVFLLLAACSSSPPVAPEAFLETQASGSIVISQVYGGGGNSGAPYTHDFVELFNRGSAPASLGGLSVQYASATGTGNFGANAGQLTELPNVELQPGQYYLVQQGAGAGNGVPLPTPDLVDPTPIAMAAGAGKVALVQGTASLGCNGGSTPCSPDQLARIIDLVGYGNANFFEGAAAAPTLSNTTAAFRVADGCTDTNDNSADFTAAAPAPRNSSSSLNPCPALAPQVVSTGPQDGATGVPLAASITITFSEPVSVTGDWFSITCTITNDVSATVMGGPTEFTLEPAAGLPGGEDCTVTIFADYVSALDGNDPPDTMDADYSFSFSTAAPGVSVCELSFTPIYDIQGSGMATPLAGQVVTTQGVVIGDYQGLAPALGGFYLQDLNGDDDPETSDGIFIFNRGHDTTITLGEVVRVTGTAGDFQDQTQISNVTSIVACGTGTVAPTDVTMPFPAPVDGVPYLERYEGMLVRFPQTLYVTEHFQLGRFGQLVMSSGDRLYQPTNVTTPGPEALALQAANDLNRIIIDDHLNNQNPDPILFGRGGEPLTASNTLRGGDTATGIVGVMTYTWAGNAASGNAYRVRPVNALDGGVPEFAPANPRPATPVEVGGSLTVSAFNVLNYFTTIDQPGASCFPSFTRSDCRGADSEAEFERQRAKIIDALAALNADVVGLIELENNPSASLADLVSGLNVLLGAGTYAFIDTGRIGGDAIKIGFIYKPGSVQPFGNYAILDTSVDFRFDDSRNRPALAQSFIELSSGGVFTAVVNHLKSKGDSGLAAFCSIPSSNPDCDQGDGQGFWNATRTEAAQALADWLQSDPTGSGDTDIIIFGDLNAYAMEDPVMVFTSSGYLDLLQAFIGSGAYSYVFDGQWGYLDHALASDSLASQVAGTTVWHINADEPNVLDYNVEFKSTAQQDYLYSPDAFRSSDHDPVLVGLSLTTDAGASLAFLVTVIEGIREDGILNAGQARSLITKLERALASLERGQIRPAANQVNAFLNEVAALVKGGILSEEQGAPLSTMAEVIHDSLR